MFDVRHPDLGAGVVNSAADQGAAINTAIAAINAAGAGTLYLADGDWEVFKVGTAYTTLGAFANCDGVTISGPGARLIVGSDRTGGSAFTTSYGNVFTFQNCKNVRIILRKGTHPDTIDETGTPKGVNFVMCTQGCENINLDQVNLEGGFISPIICQRLYNDPESYRTRNVTLGRVIAKRCWYGYACQFSGDNFTCHSLVTQGCYRSAIIYGITGHRSNIECLDQKGGAVVLQCYQGISCRDVRINYTNTRTTDAENFSHVALQWFDDVAGGTFQDVYINYDVRLPALLNGGTLFMMEKFVEPGGAYDTIDRGHRLETVVLSGTIDGDPTLVDFGLLGTNPNCTWRASGTPDVWRGLELRDLTILNGRYCSFDLSACESFHYHNFRSSHSLRLTTSDVDLQTAANCKITWSGTNEYTNRLVFDAGDSAYPVERRASDLTTFPMPAGWMNGQATYTNKLMGAAQTITLPLAVTDLEMLFVRENAFTLDLDPANAVDQSIRGASTFGKYLRLGSTGASVRLKCFEAGVWEVLQPSGTLTYEA